MDDQQRFQSRLEWLENAVDINLDSFFAQLQELHRFENIIYSTQSIDVKNAIHPPLQVASAKALEAITRPESRAICEKLLSEYWNKPAPGTCVISTIVENKQEERLVQSLKLGTHVFIFRVVSKNKTTVLLSFHINCPGDGWPQKRVQLMRDLPALAAIFIERHNDPRLRATKPTAPKLTDREIEVLSWVAVGKSYWEVSIILDIAERTVRLHMSNIRKKMNAVSNKQAVAEAALLGLVDAHHPGRPRHALNAEN